MNGNVLQEVITTLKMSAEDILKLYESKLDLKTIIILWN